MQRFSYECCGLSLAVCSDFSHQASGKDELESTLTSSPLSRGILRLNILRDRLTIEI